MRYISITLIITLFSCTLESPPIKPQLTPMEKANTIIIKTDQSKEIAYQGFIKHIIDSGYKIDINDENQFKIITNPKNLGHLFLIGNQRLEGKVVIQALIRNKNQTSIKVIGHLLTNQYIRPLDLSILDLYLSTETLRVTNFGMIGSPEFESWEKLVEIAMNYPNKTEILYGRE